MKRKTRNRNPFLAPPLKRRAIIVCPFKGAFDNSPAFQGWEKKFHGFRLFSRFERVIIMEASTFVWNDISNGLKVFAA
ncbi:MAG: hypothetical protein AB1656_24150 [Candidatus Omnitrophota bacterium]